MVLANQRTDSTFEEIPVIDITDISSRDPARRRALADKIRDACVNIMNHGIPEDVITNAVEAGKTFFALPSESKMDLDIHKSKNFKGYTALLGENTDPNGKGDLHEGFDIGYEDPSGSSSERDDGAMSGTNVWPDLTGFKEPVLSYYHSVVQLGLKLFPIFALALDLPENFFDDKTTKPAAIMRLLHYPPQSPTSLDNESIGIGAHTDASQSFCNKTTVSALQVQNMQGKWINAVPIPGTFVLNIGDQLARWTNDVFKSTIHRAINTSGKERYSIPLFFGVDYDVLLEPLPSCVSPEMPAKYEVISAGDYVKSRLEETYAHSADK
ncbi:Clavaminate synthase-like protein [Gymnopus androsaceus JB14]|uniref:Clavaminate synthase-like protein n=1 Tax=Gymnopus androsaceus JB14 TaxID=1447944 RepID=A0A6A4HGD2_9AGAR|nr:Clavaminate synthase-like protein [Gymnopus androsaceus JB14]